MGEAIHSCTCMYAGMHTYLHYSYVRGEPTGLALAAARFLALRLCLFDRSGCVVDGDRVVRRLRCLETAIGGYEAVVVDAATAACARTPHKHARTSRPHTCTKVSHMRWRG